MCEHTHLRWRCTRRAFHVGACLAFHGAYAIVFSDTRFLYHANGGVQMVSAAWMRMFL